MIDLPAVTGRDKDKIETAIEDLSQRATTTRVTIGYDDRVTIQMKPNAQQTRVDVFVTVTEVTTPSPTLADSGRFCADVADALEAGFTQVFETTPTPLSAIEDDLTERPLLYQGQGLTTPDDFEVAQ